MKLKYFLLGYIIVLILAMNITKAEEIAPKPFANSDIKRTLNDGKVQKFDGNKYMIVKRGVKSKPEIKIVEKPVYKKNAIKLFLGYGPNDLNRRNNSVELDSDPLLGIGYQRMLNEDFSLEVIGISNESLLIGGGYHF